MYTWSAGDQITAARLNQTDPETNGRLNTAEHNIIELYLENYYGNLSTPSIGLFFDGFSDSSKIDDTISAINASVSSGQPDVTVVNGSLFTAGQEVDIFDTSNSNIETKIIQSIATNVLTMTTNFSNSYTTAGFVSRSSVDLNTGPRTISVQPEFTYGVYRSNKTTFQQAVDTVKHWISRQLSDGVNRFPIGAAVSSGATTITISGDYTAVFSNGDTIDIYNSTNTVRERKTLTASPSFGGGFTTLTFTGQGISNPSGFSTSGKIERVDILPMASLVDTGDDEDFQAMTYESSITSESGSVVLESYSESNQDNLQNFSGAALSHSGQSFDSAAGGNIRLAQFYLKKTGTPTGTIYAEIYAHTGSFGSTGTPTGAALATSDPVSVASLTTSLALVSFNFSGANRIALSPSTKYVIVFNGSGVSGSSVNLGDDESSPSHAGNYSEKVSGTWTGYSTIDLPFYVYVTTTVAEDAYNYTAGSPGHDFIIKLTLR